MNLAVIGVGYVGLVTGACLADIGHQVVCIDVDEDKIAGLSKGKLPIYEPGLDEVVARNVHDGRLVFSSDIQEGIRISDLVFIAVGTPSDDSGAADLSQVKSAAAEISRTIDRYKVIVNKSTVPVGSTKLVEQIITKNMPHFHEFDVVSNPEFLREGSAIEDFLHPDRIIIGTKSQRAIGLMTELYKPLNAPLVITDPASAEMIKYASNAFLATKVSFINAIANVCEAIGADVKEVALGMGYDKRIGFEFLKAGPGWGGSCFPKDCKALIKMAEEYGYDFRLLKGALEVNEMQQRLVVGKVKKLLGNIRQRKIGILGLSFKPNTDDVRDSPAIGILKELKAEGAIIKAYDPVAMENAKKLLPDIEYCSSAYEVTEDCNALLLLTEWDEFKWLDFSRVKSLLQNPIVIDTRNCLDPHTLKQLGFVYEGVGR